MVFAFHFLELSAMKTESPTSKNQPATCWRILLKWQARENHAGLP